MTSLGIIDREQAIDTYDLSFVRENVSSGNSLNDEDLNKIELEFRRFLKLVLSEQGPLAVIDHRVDKLWHSFILFTPQYQRFCEDVMGFFVHHQPRTSKTPVSDEAIQNFVDAYRRRYGSLDPFWLEQLPPELRAGIVSGTVPKSPAFKWSGWTGKLTLIKNPADIGLVRDNS